MTVHALTRCDGCAMRETGLCAGADRPARAALAAAGRLRRLSADQPLFPQGETRRVAILRSGRLRYQRLTAEGRRRIPALAWPGDVAGPLFRPADDCAVEAAADSEVCVFERATLERMIRRDPGLERRLHRTLAATLDRMLNFTWMLLSLRAEERIAGYLLVARFLEGPDPEDPDLAVVDIPRKDLADLLGLSPETVSRAAHALARRGLVEILDSRRFRLIAREELEARTGLDGPALQAAFGRPPGEGGGDARRAPAAAPARLA